MASRRTGFFTALCFLLLPVISLAATVRPPQTGQTMCYSMAGSPCTCGDAGCPARQDGELRVGVAWPDPRFTTNGDGTITDNLTGLIWAPEGNMPNFGECNPWYWLFTWQEALDYVKCLNNNTYLGHQDWRMPNILELESLRYANGTTDAWLNSSGFTNMQGVYWSSTTVAYIAAYAWIFFADGSVTQFPKDTHTYVLPVRGTSTPPGQVWRTGQTACYDASGTVIGCAGTGQDGEYRAGAAWPSPRFVDKQDGTVKDRLTGLVWLKQMDCLGWSNFWDEAFATVESLNTDPRSRACEGYTGVHADWRLPNVKELLSLTDYSAFPPVLPAGHPFITQFVSLWFHSSTSHATYPENELPWNMEGGITQPIPKTGYTNWIWPVRGGIGSDLTVSLVDDHDPVEEGEAVTYTITITNDGPEAATGVSLSNPVPPGASFVSVTSTQGTCAHVLGVVTCDLGTLSSDAEVTVTLRLQAPATGGLMTNTATATCTCGDVDPSSNTASEDTVVGFLRLPETGQGKCYNTTGTEIVCAGTGQDGEILAGVDWPNPRFTDNLDGTITDRLTGLTWLKDANCTATIHHDPDGTGDGSLSWQHALDFVAGINGGAYSACGAGHDDWRLPNINEMSSLVHYGCSEESCGAGPCSSVAQWLEKQGFANSFGWSYWSSSSLDYYGYTNSARIVETYYGLTDHYRNKASERHHVWPVRGNTESSPGPVWKTGQTRCYDSTGVQVGCAGTGQDGELQAGFPWPTPRLIDNADGTVTDNLSGLMWLQDANCIASQYPGLDIDGVAGDGAVSWQHAIQFVAGINDGIYPLCGAGHDDWRMPNQKEYQSLADYSQSNPTLPKGHPFSNASTYVDYWASTSVSYLPQNAWRFNVTYGSMYTWSKSGSYRVWPVRGGRTPEVAVADLSVSKTDSADPVVGGSSLTYTITLTNGGPDTATGVILTDPLPAGSTFVSASSTKGGCAHAAGTVTCDMGYVAPGANVTVTITVAAPAAAGLMTNTATVSSTSTDPEPSNNSASHGTTVLPLTYALTVGIVGSGSVTGSGIDCPGDCTEDVPNTYPVHTQVSLTANAAFGWQFDHWTGPVSNAASNPALVTMDADKSVTAHFVRMPSDLSVTKTDSPDPVIAGTNLTYTIVVTNNGPGPATGVGLSDPLPSGTTFVFATSTQGTCGQTAGTVSCDLGDLPNGSSATVSIVVTAPGTPGPLSNTAMVSCTGPDANPANNSSTQDTTVSPATYTLNVSVLGSGGITATGIACPGDCTEPYANGTDVLLTANADPGWQLDHWSGDLTGSANPTTVRMDGNKDVTAHFAQVLSDLSVVKSDHPNPVAAAARLTYSVVVTNNGPGFATGVTLSDALPAGVTFVSAAPSQGTCVEAAGTVSCNLGDLANTASAAVTIVVSAPATPGPITNTAAVSCISLDPTPANNTATQETNVLPDNDSDGVPDAVEMGPDGTNPDYDGNGDGIPDSQQNNAASLHSFDGLNYFTIASPAGTLLAAVAVGDNPSPGDTPAGVDFPYGFFGFTVNGLASGAATTVSLYLPAGQSLATYYKFGPTPGNPTPHWYEFLYDGQTGAAISGNVVTLHFVDGQRGDNDLNANGVVTDPGAPGVRAGGVSPAEGTIGTLISITGTGFGHSRPAVYLEYDNGAGESKRACAKVMSWSDTGIACIWNKKVPPPGVYDLYVQPKRGTPIYVGAFAIRPPQADPLGSSSGSPGREVVLTGRFFGCKQAKPRVYFEFIDARGRTRGVICRPAQNGIEWNASTGESRLRFYLPSLRGTTGAIKLRNLVGQTTAASGFTIR